MISYFKRNPELRIVFILAFIQYILVGVPYLLVIVSTIVIAAEILEGDFSYVEVARDWEPNIWWRKNLKRGQELI